MGNGRDRLFEGQRRRGSESYGRRHQEIYYGTCSSIGGCQYVALFKGPGKNGDAKNRGFVWRGIWGLTTKMLMTPRNTTTIPEDITIRQKESPRDFSLVACLLRFPRIETPTMIISTPRVTKPEDGLRRGQFRVR